ncbi:MAG: twin-arginine translocase subunit TatC [Planctomycetota bacterium]
MAERIDDVRMSIGEHLEELRRRLFYSLVSFFLVFFVTFLFRQPVRDFALAPLTHAMIHAKAVYEQKKLEPAYVRKTSELKIQEGPKFVVETTNSAGEKVYEEAKYPMVVKVIDEHELDLRPTVLSPQEGVFQDLKLSMLVALLFAAPFLLYQVWAFVRAGLYDNERKSIAPYLPFVILMFVSGAAFGYFIMLPLILRELETWLPVEKINIQNRLQEYLSLFYTFTFWLGLIFEIPVVMMMLARVGIIRSRGFIRAWRWAVLGGVLAGAILNPAPDVMTQMIFAAPIVGLYFLGCALAYLAERSRERAQAR